MQIVDMSLYYLRHIYKLNGFIMVKHGQGIQRALFRLSFTFCLSVCPSVSFFYICPCVSVSDTFFLLSLSLFVFVSFSLNYFPLSPSLCRLPISLFLFPGITTLPQIRRSVVSSFDRQMSHNTKLMLIYLNNCNTSRGFVLENVLYL